MLKMEVVLFSEILEHLITPQHGKPEESSI